MLKQLSLIKQSSKERILLVAIFVLLYFAGGCGEIFDPRPISTSDKITTTIISSQTPLNAPLSTPITTHSGSAYLVLSTAEAPYLHRLVRTPIGCLQTTIDCPPTEVIASYPQEGVTPSRMHWSPDGNEALFLDTYEPRVLRFNPTDDSLNTLLDNVPTVRDDLIWLPDGRPVFVVQGAEDYESELVTLERENGDTHLHTLASFAGTAYLLGSDVEGNLIITLDVYDFPSEDSFLKKAVVDVRLLSLDPATTNITELWGDIDWQLRRPESLLPDGCYMIFGSDSVNLWDLQNGVEIPVGTHVVLPEGSPDGNWLAAVIENSNGVHYQVLAFNLETGERRFLAESTNSIHVFWTPDSRNVVLTPWGSGSIQVAALEGGTVVTPSLDLGEFTVIEDLSWGPENPRY